MKLYIFTSFLFLSLVSFELNAQGKTFFRYKNDQGVLVMTDSIPPEYATKGFEIIDSSGRVVRTIDPELSAEEKERRKTELAEKERLQKWDNELSSRYSTVNDIEAAKARRLEDLDNSIYTLRLSTSNILEVIKQYQAEAANKERQGEVVDNETLKTIKKLQRDRQIVETEIEKRLEEKETLAKKFDEDIERFKLIKSNSR